MVAHNRGPLLPKLRGQIAEFLQHRSLKRLGMLYQSTCVGFGYGLVAGALSRNAFEAGPIRSGPTTHGIRHTPAGPGMFTWFPSATAVALALGAGSPCADWPCAGTLGLSAGGFLTLLVATHVRIRTSDTSSGPRGSAFAGLRNAPLPRTLRCTHSFGRWLEPRYIFAAGQLLDQ